MKPLVVNIIVNIMILKALKVFFEDGKIFTVTVMAFNRTNLKIRKSLDYLKKLKHTIFYS